VGKQSAYEKSRAAGTPADSPDLRPIPGGTVVSRLPELDRLIHERMRLGILSALAVNDALSFHDLKRLLNTTDGNLSVHARKLEEAGYVACKKSFDGRMPRTEFNLTDSGRQAFRRYLDHMEALIQATKKKP